MGGCTDGVAVKFHEDGGEVFVDVCEVAVCQFYFDDGEFYRCFLELEDNLLGS